MVRWLLLSSPLVHRMSLITQEIVSLFVFLARWAYFQANYWPAAIHDFLWMIKWPSQAQQPLKIILINSGGKKSDGIGNQMCIAPWVSVPYVGYRLHRQLSDQKLSNFSTLFWTLLRGCYCNTNIGREHFCAAISVCLLSFLSSILTPHRTFACCIVSLRTAR